MEACAQRRLDLLYCLGGNFLRTLPEPEHVRGALANVPLRVHQDLILTVPALLAEADVSAGRLKVLGRQEGSNRYWLIAPVPQWRQKKVKALVTALTA